MASDIIVGGGLGGLLLARDLLKKGRKIEGFEPSERLGGRFLSGIPRFLDTGSLEFLSEVVTGVEWSPRQGEPKTRKKGEWDVVSGDFPLQEQFLLTPEYYVFNSRPKDLIQELVEEVAPHFHLRRRIVEVRPQEKTCRADDGSEFEYDSLFWCAGLGDLRKASTDELPTLTDALKHLSPAHGGLCLDWDLDAPLVEGDFTVVFPFRFKDWKLRAIGVPGRWGTDHTFHWYLFLEEELLEDREEVAKCVRALKRELGKEFPESKDRVTAEKLSYFPVMACEKPAALGSLQVADGLWVLGSEGGQAENDRELPRNLDLLINNFRRIREALPAGEPPSA